MRTVGEVTVPPRVRSTGDGRGVDGPGVNAYVKRYGGPGCELRGTVKMVGGDVPPWVRPTGDGRGVDGPGVDVGRYGGTWGVEDEGQRG